MCLTLRVTKYTLRDTVQCFNGTVTLGETRIKTNIKFTNKLVLLIVLINSDKLMMKSSISRNSYDYRMMNNILNIDTNGSKLIS